MMDSFNSEIPFLTGLKKTPAYLLEFYKYNPQISSDLSSKEAD